MRGVVLSEETAQDLAVMMQTFYERTLTFGNEDTAFAAKQIKIAMVDSISGTTFNATEMRLDVDGGMFVAMDEGLSWGADDVPAIQTLNQTTPPEVGTIVPVWMESDSEGSIRWVYYDSGTDFDHPFKLSVSGNSIKIGSNRGSADFDDIINVYTPEGNIVEIAKSSEETVDLSGAGNGTFAIYYKIVQTSLNVWAATPDYLAEASWPTEDHYGQLLWRIGTAVKSADGLEKGQEVFSNPVLWQRAILRSFDGYYIGDGDDTGSIVITGGQVSHLEGSSIVAGDTFSLDTDLKIYLEVSNSEGSETPVVSSLQSTTEEWPATVVETTGTLTYTIRIAEIASGVVTLYQSGDIDLPSTFYQPGFHADIQYGDAQGVRVLGIDSADGLPATVGDSENPILLKGRKTGLEFIGGNLEDQDDVAETILYGTSDDVTAQPVVTAVSNTSGTVTFSVKHRKHEVARGLTQINEFSVPDPSEDVELVFTQVTYITDIRYDSSDHQIQVKTRQGWVLDLNAESDWTNKIAFSDVDAGVGLTLGGDTLDLDRTKIYVLETDGVGDDSVSTTDCP